MSDVSADFLTTYLLFTQAGETEIPAEYHLHCAISLIAAAVADRVWINKLGKHICNLYTLLIGDSASGKGNAISRAEEVISDIPYINTLEIRTSAPALMDMMCSIDQEDDGDGRIIDHNKVFIITPELKDNIGSKEKAQDFISWATSVWEGTRPIPIIESTRNSGTHVLIEPCINWLAGSTKQWLIESISVSAIQGGFFGRVACVQPKSYNLEERKWNIPKLKNKQKLLDLLRMRLKDLTHVKGEFKLSESADQYLGNWYHSRPVPDKDSPIAAVWKRLPQMVFKFSMILSLSESDELIIELHHAKRARELAEDLLNGVQNLLVYASVTPKTEVVYKMSVMMRQAKMLPRTYLLNSLGVTLDDFELALRTLIESRSIVLETKGKMVKWIGA